MTTTFTYLDAILKVEDSTVATNTTTVANTGVVVETTIFGSDYTNTITGGKILMETPNNSKKTEIVPAEIVIEQTNGGLKAILANTMGQSPALNLSLQSLNDPPDFPFQFCSLTTSGLSANNSFGWNLDVPKLLLNSGASTTGQVITADANGRPVWATPAGWVGTATSNLDMDNYSIVDVNNVGMVNGTLTASSSTVATDTTTITNNEIEVSGLSFGTQYSNTITPVLTTISNPTGTLKTEYGLGLIQGTVVSSSDGNTYNYTLRTSQQQQGSLTFTTTPPSPDPAVETIYSTTGLSSNRTAGYNINISNLKLNGDSSTEGQVITANSSGRPIWATPAITLGSTNTWTGANSFTDIVSTATLAAGDSSTKVSTTSFVTSALSAYNTSLLAAANTWNGVNTFSVAPQSVTPVLGTDVSTKGYVDSMAGQYGGGLNLFLNYSSTSSVSPYKLLSKTVSTSPSQTVVNDLSITTAGSMTVLVASFMAEPLGLTVIPTGLWDMIIYGSVNNIAGTVNYFYKLYKYSAGVSTLIGESSNTQNVSTDVNSSNPNSYPAIYTISSEQTLLTTDRVYIELHAKRTGSTLPANSVLLTTYFEGANYSYVGTSLNAGTTLLGSNNTWTGTNSFITDTSFLSIKTPSINGALVSNLATNTPLGIGDLQTGTAGTINIGTANSRLGEINIMTGTLSNGNVNIKTNTGTGSVGIGSSTTTSTEIKAATLKLNSDNTTANVVNIGNATGTTAITFNRPLTLAYTTTPTAGTMLGGITTGTYATTGYPVTSPSTPKAIATLSIPTIGIYMVYFNFTINISGAVSIFTSIGGTALPLPVCTVGITFVNNGIYTTTGTFIAPITTVGTLVLNMTLVGTVTSLANTSYSAVRIA